VLSGRKLGNDAPEVRCHVGRVTDMATHLRRVVAELAAAQHGVVTRAQAATHHLDARRIATMLRQGLLHEPRPGVLVVRGSPHTWQQELTVATLAFRAAAAHRSAARLHRLEPFVDSDAIEVLVAQGRQRHDVAVAVRRARELDPGDVVVVDGIRTTSIARTLCDLGAVASDDAVEQALDDALRRGTSLRWITETHQRLARPGPSGSGALGRVLALPDRQGTVPDSWRERVTERLLRHPELAGLVRQHRVQLGPGGRVARLDLALVDARLGLEFHSDQWHFGPRAGRSDRRRDVALARLGWEVMYLDSSDHRSPAGARDAVLDVARQRRRLLLGATSA